MLIGNKNFDLKNSAYVCGILNVTPDSFSDGGQFDNLDAALFHTEEMINDNLEVNKANKLQQFETLFTEQEREGKYEEKEGKLYLSNSTTEAVNEETDFYADYEIKDGQLTLKNESETESC